MNYYNEIKNKLIDNEVYKRVKDYSKNRNDLSTYYEVGKLLIEAQGGEDRAKYGDALIKEYSERLKYDINILITEGENNLIKVNSSYISITLSD